MSDLTSSGTNMISTITGPDQTTRKDVSYIPEDRISRDLTDAFGNKISVHHIGRLQYSTYPSADNYIYKFRICKYGEDDSIIMHEVYSDIDLSRVDEDPDYAYAIANILLSSNNIDFSKAYGYVGELCESPTDLEDGTEKIVHGIYSYKIPNSQYSLVFDGERIQALRAYNEEQEKQKSGKKEQEGEDR